MEGNIRDVLGYIRGAAKMIIPVYQRNYDWRTADCERLMNDLISLQTENKKAHFFGSIVVKPGNFSQEIVIIDGQQRLTTISLLLLAMKNWQLQHEVIADWLGPNTINDTYLENATSRNKTDKIRLSSNPRDYEAYKKLFGDKKFYVENSNITQNYNYFYLYLDKLSISLEQLMESLEKLQLMVVNLNSENDDPQLIFESLNSTGVDLTDADKIRNFLLMNEEQEPQEYYFENYWEPIELRTHLKLDEFFRNYLMLKNRKYPNLRQVYESFTKYYQKNVTDKTTLFDELSEYSFAFQQVIEAKSSDKKINLILNRFNELEITVIRPFLMAIIRDFNNNVMTSEEVISIFNSLENYVARRLITKVPSNSLQKVISTLYSNLQKLSTNPENVDISLIDLFNFLLLQKEKNTEFPSDESFVNSLLTNDFYKINNNVRNYIFERLENYNHNEALNIYENIHNHEFSVEHIMPQKLSKQWIEDLGENYLEIHRNYVNSLGNLTLTGYNSQYSNRSFKQKQTMKRGFKESHFYVLNRIPATSVKWTEKEIKERSQCLTNLALKVWPYPTTSYQPKIEEKGMIIYNGEQDFTGYRILGYSFLDGEYKEVTTWKSFYIDVLKQLVEIDPEKIAKFARDDSERGLNRIFGESKEFKEDSIEIYYGIFAYASISNWNKFNNIKKLLDEYELNYDTLIIDARKK